MSDAVSTNSIRPSEPRTRTRLEPAAAVLWASAFIIAALVIVQAGQLPGNAAFAESAVARGDYTLLTARTNRGDDIVPDHVLYVIDNREQVLMVYEIENVQQSRLLLRDGASLETLFRNAMR